MRLHDLALEIHETAVEKGWWREPRSFPELIALCHSELSEALEAWRDGDSGGIHYGREGKPEGITVELADCIIRILDICAALHLPIDRALQEKMEYNKKRPYRHGGKKA